MGGVEMVLSRIDFALIFTIILFLEVVKALLNRFIKKKIPTWVWKVAVIVCGFVASIIASPNSTIPWFKSVFLYAAGATIIYQSGKAIIKPIVDHLFPKGKKSEGKDNTDT